jgi:hypothetical protein
MDASRFVLLSHNWPSPHEDLLLERGGLLLGWRLPHLATLLKSAEPIRAIQSSDHRLAYLDYEGPVSGGRGDVCRQDSGMLDWIAWEPDQLLFHLAGKTWNGVYSLVRLTSDEWDFSAVR